MKKFNVRVRVEFDFEIETDIAASILRMNFDGENGSARISYEYMETYVNVEVESIDEESVENDIMEHIIEDAVKEKIVANHIWNCHIRDYSIDDIDEITEK